MALKAYTLDLALQTSSEFAIGHTIPNVEGIATDGKGFIPTKNSINKTITLSKGFGKFGGRLFEMTEQTVYSWDSGSTDADAYLVIDLTKQNSFTGTIEDGTYTFVDNQSSIVISSTRPEPSANTLVYKLDGNYQTENYRSFSDFTVSGTVKTAAVKTASVTASGLSITFREYASGIEVYFSGTFTGNAAYKWNDLTTVPDTITKPYGTVTTGMSGRTGIGSVTSQTDVFVMIRINNTGKIQYEMRHGVEGNTNDYNGLRTYLEGSLYYFK